jgi:uncharacterized RDD family membrane protein YckC
MSNAPAISRIRRAAATLIDLALVLLIFLIFGAVCVLLFKVSVGMDTLDKFLSYDPNPAPNPANQIYGLVESGCCLFVTWLYFVQMEASRYRGTLGKLAVGLQVVDFAGEQISGIRATLRFVVSVLRAAFIFMLCLFITSMIGMDTRFSDFSVIIGMGGAFFLVVFLSGKRGQRIQDFVSRTRVTRRG